MTSGPATRLLNAFRALATQWLLSDKAGCELHGGRFDAAELKRFQVAAPAVRAGCLALASARDDGGGAALLDFRLAAVVIGRRTAKGEPSGAQARRLASRVAFELAREQRAGEGFPWPGRRAWPQAAFSPAELDPARTDSPRWDGIGDPREIRAASLYDGKLDSKGLALWAVTWMQQFRARPEDFDLPLPDPAWTPDTVLSGFAPDIGRGHEGDYGQVHPEGA